MIPLLTHREVSDYNYLQVTLPKREHSALFADQIRGLNIRYMMELTHYLLYTKHN